MELLTSVLWLALNMYHEARSEGEIGQLAVAHVTINRAENRNLSIEKIVNQPFQFSWTMEGKMLPDDVDSFVECLSLVEVAADGYDFTSGATHYHRVDVIPEWTNRMEFVGRFGDHFFYKEIGQ